MGIGAWLPWAGSQLLGSVLHPELLSHAAGSAEPRPLLLRWCPSRGSIAHKPMMYAACVDQLAKLSWSKIPADIQCEGVHPRAHCCIAKTPYGESRPPWLWLSACPRPPPVTASNGLQLRQVQRIVAGMSPMIPHCEPQVRSLCPGQAIMSRLKARSRRRPRSPSSRERY